MESEKNKKIIKWGIVMIIAGILTVFCFIFALRWWVKYIHYQNWKSTHQPYGYLISGRGCNDMADVSDEELKKYVKEDILSQISKKKFVKVLMEDKEGFESGEYKKDSCAVMVDRVLNVINDLK